MAFTYDGTLDTDLEKVRLEIGDTDSTDPQFTDAEITYFLNEEGTVLGAALRACIALVAKYAREFDFETDQQKFSRSQKHAAYLALTEELAEKIGSSLATLSQTKVDGYSQDIDSRTAVQENTRGHASVGYFNPDRSW